MRTEEKLRRILVDWKEFETPELVRRDFEYRYLGSDKILTVTGPRRAGKTYLCFQMADYLKDKGVPEQNILYINLEDERLHPIKGDELTKLLDVYYELFEPERGKIYLFLDEVHEVPNWEIWSRRTSEKEKDVKLVLTGSSSELLPGELSTRLRGRSLNTAVYPFSFREFLRAKGVKYDVKKAYYGKKKSLLRREFNKYLKFGGFPEVVLEEDEKLKEEILRQYYSVMFQRDIIERFGVDNVGVMQDFLKMRMDNFARPMTYTKSRNNLKSLGHKVGKATLKRYFSHARDVFLMFDVKKYSPKMKNQLRYPRKVYPVDTGLVNAVRFDFSEDRGRALETMVFLELLRRGKEVYYHRNGGECDFLVRKKGKVKEALQVTETLQGTEDRESKGLTEALEEYGLDEGLILTEDEKDKVGKKGFQVDVLPVWLWLLRGAD